MGQRERGPWGEGDIVRGTLREVREINIDRESRRTKLEEDGEEG